MLFRSVYSIFTNKIDKHPSADNFKKNQFVKYKNKIIEAQSKYAKICNASYKLFETTNTNYNEIQFEKLYLFDELANDYDEVLYLDFDVIPIKNSIIFERFNLNTMCACSINKHEEFIHKLNEVKNLTEMHMFIKTTSKKAMLSIHDINGSDDLINTGVLLANKKVIKSIDLKNNLKEASVTFNKSKDDNIYYDDITKLWIKNNEAFFSYIIEKYNIPYTNIGILWNFILNHKIKTVNPSAYFVHVISKEFERIFE